MLLINKKKKRGVALIFFLLVFGILLGFLMMVVNTGMLVYQKIRLQTAVDLAAYAGASVQASYLGNDSSGEQSIRALNSKILERYGKLTNDMQFGSVSPWPYGFPDSVSCAVACQAANLANGEYVANLFRNAASDMEGDRQKILRILQGLPKAAQAAAEQTIAMNIPDVAIAAPGSLAAAFGSTTNDVVTVLKQNAAASILQSKKNAVMSFSSAKGLYLATVVASVPHTFANFGPFCFDAYQGAGVTNHAFYCTVNGVGAPGVASKGKNSGKSGFQGALLAYAKSYSPIANGNIGSVAALADSNASAIRLHFITNENKPDPFFLVSAEWYPPNGTFLNLENSLGATGSLFPKQTRLVAVAAAEPFGGDLITLKSRPFGTRLTSIRKVLLDPRMDPTLVKSDFRFLMDYMQTLGPADITGKVNIAPEDVIRKFLH